MWTWAGSLNITGPLAKQHLQLVHQHHICGNGECDWPCDRGLAEAAESHPFGQLICVELNGERLCSQVNLISSCCSGGRVCVGYFMTQRQMTSERSIVSGRLENQRGSRTDSVEVHNPLLLLRRQRLRVSAPIK